MITQILIILLGALMIVDIRAFHRAAFIMLTMQDELRKAAKAIEQASKNIGG